MADSGPAAPRHIVLVDDDVDVRETLEEYLAGQGYALTALDGGAALRRLVESGAPIDLAILDITMPGEDGLSLARFLRAERDLGIIMVTASGATAERVAGLELGADDYMPKPVDLRELLARIKAVLRRRVLAAMASRGSQAGTGAEAGRVVAMGDCRLHLDAHRLTGADGEEVPLTAMEFALLKVFAERPNRVLSREQLMDLAHDRNPGETERRIDIRIARLRRKLERDPSKPEIIRTLRGSGYMFVPGGGAEAT